MSKILPDDIRELSNNTAADVQMIYGYIKYMQEQLDFWTNRKEIDLDDMKARIAALEEGE